jgi:hypothetical protein
MKRFLLMALLAGSPAFANDRAEGEARLAALSAQISAVLGAVVVQPAGMVCETADSAESAMTRAVLPSAWLTCRWEEAAEMQEASVALAFSPELSAQMQVLIDTAGQMQQAGTMSSDRVKVIDLPNGPVVRMAMKIIAVPSPKTVILGETDMLRPLDAPDAMDDLAETLGGLDLGALDGSAVATEYLATMADHRALLTAQRLVLAAMFPATVDGVDPARMLPPDQYPDLRFFGAEPLVQADVVQGGVGMLVTLTTSTFALEAAAEEGRFTDAAVNGDVSRGGVYHDRGRVKVYLGEKALTALIDGRGMLMLDVAEVDEGADPVAAMEAVLAGIAANDFSDY